MRKQLIGYLTRVLLHLGLHLWMLHQAVDLLWMPHYLMEMEVSFPYSSLFVLFVYMEKFVEEHKYCFTEYRLIGLVSHIGTSTQCGHYVAHVYKEGRWVIFNDDKVGISKNPPKDMAYLYFYERIQS